MGNCVGTVGEICTLRMRFKCQNSSWSNYEPVKHVNWALQHLPCFNLEFFSFQYSDKADMKYTISGMKDGGICSVHWDIPAKFVRWERREREIFTSTILVLYSSTKVLTTRLAWSPWFFPWSPSGSHLGHPEREESMDQSHLCHLITSKTYTKTKKKIHVHQTQH